jgi:superfamily II DNA/RNA helicase
VLWLYRKLEKIAAMVTADMIPRKRLESMRQFKMGIKNVLISTNLCSRAIETYCNVVINYDMPNYDGVFDSKAYLHRVGRTGRMGRGGVAITFINPSVNASSLLDIFHMEPLFL